MRFIHTADWQLGMTRRRLGEDAQARYSAARRDAVAGLRALADAEGAAFVVVAGDVFEHNQLDPQVISQSLEAMRAIGVPVYLLPGNHDPLDAASVYTSALFREERPDNVVVLDAGVHTVAAGVQLVAAPWDSKRPTTDLAGAALAALPDPAGAIRVLIAHGGVDVLDPDTTNPALIRMAELQAALDRGAVHYVALGDKHSRTDVGDGGRVWYSGSPEVTNFDDVEADPGHVLVVDIDETDPQHPVTVASRRVGRWRFRTLRRQLDTAADVAAFAAELDALPDKDRTMVRVGLTGALSVTDHAALDDVLDKQGRRFAALYPWQRHTDLVVVPADGEFDDLGLGGFAAAAVEELLATARGDDDVAAADAQAALGLLLRLAGQDRGAA